MADYDLSSLMELLGNDEEALKDILRAFLSDCEKYLSPLEEGVEKENFEEIRKNAHAMRSVVGNFNLKELYDEATNLETAGKECKTDGLKDVLEKFISGIGDFRTWIKKEYEI
ncbi:MAG: Hpt domain-containing protein [bacterium]|nr:Hpt domain-containing protein [bacterium]